MYGIQRSMVFEDSVMVVVRSVGVQRIREIVQKVMLPSGDTAIDGKVPLYDA
jgi:hypothetical protein